MTFLKLCDICAAPGHKAKDCALNRLEEQRDPIGELKRRQEYRNRAQARQERLNKTMSAGSAQTSRGFGL